MSNWHCIYESKHSLPSSDPSIWVEQKMTSQSSWQKLHPIRGCSTSGESTNVLTRSQGTNTHVHPKVRTLFHHSWDSLAITTWRCSLILIQYGDIWSTLLHNILPSLTHYSTRGPGYVSCAVLHVFKRDLWAVDSASVIILRGCCYTEQLILPLNSSTEQLSIFKTCLYNFSHPIGAKNFEKRLLDEILPKQYHVFLSLLNKDVANRLPSHQSEIDCEIRLMDGVTPTWEPVYCMWRVGLVVQIDLWQDNMMIGCIWRSSLAFAAAVFFPKKPDWGLRFCIDYTDINSTMVKNQYPRLWLRETLNLCQEAQIFPKLHVPVANTLWQVKWGDKYKVAS